MWQSTRRVSMLASVLAGILCTSLTNAGAAPVEVRFPEGVSKGYVVLQEPEGRRLADGEMSQVATGPERVVNRLVLRFKDGSVHDETVTFSQKEVFKMLQYQLEQKGPAFPHTLRVALNGKTGEFTVRRGPTTEDPSMAGTVTLPPDVYNGLTVTVLKNLPDSSELSFHLVTFDPKATLHQVRLRPVSTEDVKVGGKMTKAIHYQMKPVLSWWTKVLAWFSETSIPEYDFWLTKDDVPAFVRYEGPFYSNGPVWQLVQTAPRLASSSEQTP